MTLHAGDLLRYVIRPTINALEMGGEAAEQLLLGTAIHESTVEGATRLHQIRGPALGIYQMEPATHDDIWTNWLAYQQAPRRLILGWVPNPTPDHLMFDLRYATAMARCHYRRVSESLPEAGDVLGLAEYAKQYYNTPAGKATVAQYAAGIQLAINAINRIDAND